MRDDRAFIEDMLQRIALVEEFTVSGKTVFYESRMMQEAVIRSLEVMGEASRNISEDLRDAHPEVPWRQIAAFRNFVIHAYWDIKLDRIWDVVENELTPLKPQLLNMLASLDQEDQDDNAIPDE